MGQGEGDRARVMEGRGGALGGDGRLGMTIVFKGKGVRAAPAA